jgi:uncharacterized membrane protein YkvA (DUF1232 family)
MSKKITKGQAAKELEKGAKRVTEDDVGKVLTKQKDIEDKFKTGGPLGRFIEDLKLLFSVVKDYYKGRYRRIPWFSIGSIVFALLYVLNPVDLIPDFIPVIGYVDDALVVAACLALVKQDLEDYKKWKKING